jgi:hypothetical protein
MKLIVPGLSSVALVAGSLLWVTVPVASPAFAASVSQRECEANGGTYVKNGADATCVYPETKPGYNPPGTQGSESQTTSTGQGNIDNKTVTTCEGNPGQCKK